MAKGDFSSLKVDSFGRGINLVDPIEEMDVGYLGPLTRNVLPAGNAKSIQRSSGVNDIIAPIIPNSATRRPVQMTRYLSGLLVGNEDGSVDRIAQNLGTITSFAATDGAGIPDIIVSQDSALTTYYAYILRPNGSGATSVKVNLSTAASVTWPGTPPQGTCAISWKTMMVIGQGSRLRFSTQANPDSWPANNFIDIKTLDDAADDIVGFEILGEDLIVFKKRSVWMVFDPISFDNRRLFTSGLASRQSSCRLGDRIFWISPDGPIFSTEGETLKNETLKLGNVFPLLDVSQFSYQKYGSFVATPNGTLVACDGSGLLVGYTQFRDFEGNMPWFSCKDNTYANIRGLVWANSDFSGSTNLSDNPGTNNLLASVWNLAGANTNCLATSVDVSGTQIAGQSHINGGTAVKSIIEIPTFHNNEVEGFSRLRKLNLYGHGTLGTTGVAAVEIYKDNAGAATLTLVGSAFTNEFVRFRPELRGRTFKVIIKSDGVASYFALHTLEAQFRRAGL